MTEKLIHETLSNILLAFTNRQRLHKYEMAILLTSSKQRAENKTKIYWYRKTRHYYFFFANNQDIYSFSILP